MKTQLLLSPDNQVIYVISCDKGKTHDFQIFKNSKIAIPKNIELLADSGYQGIKNIHFNKTFA